MKLTLRTCMLLSAALSGGFCSAPVLAQNTETTGAVDSADGSGFEEITVTAERRSTTLERTPIAITVLEQGALAANKIENGADLIKFTPGLNGGPNVGNSVASSFFIRGLGQDDSSPLVDSAVGVYIDDVYVARQYSNNIFLYDIDQVEVLRGPQGILYGRNTSGGAIKISTIKPSDTFSARLDADYGNYESYSLKGSFNIPITDRLFVRAGMFTKQRDKGYVRNIETGEPTTVADQWGGRIAARYLASDDLTLDLSFESFSSKTPGDRSANILLPTSSLFRTESGLRGSYSNISDDRATMTVTLTPADNITLKSISAYDNPKWSYLNDFSGLPAAIYILYADYDTKIYSQEFQFSGDFLDGRLQTTLGAFAFREKGNNFDAQNVFSGLIQDINVYENRTRSLAAYGQLRLNLTDALSVSAGLRYTDERRALDITGFSLSTGQRVFSFDNDDIIAAGNKTRLKFRRTSPKFGIEYQVTPRILAYASYTEGFRSGSFNQRAFNARDFTSFDPEEVKAYEAGVKGLFFDRKVRANVSVYRNDYGNFIVNQVNPTSGNFVTANAASVRIQGIEGELALQVTPQFQIHANTSILDAKYRRLDAGVGIPVTNKVKFTPPFTASIGFDWEIPAPLSPRLTANYFHSARYYVGLGNFNAEHVPLRDLVDAQFSIRPTDTTTLGVFCQNCLDDRYFVTAISAAVLGFETQTVGTPRTYGVRFGFSY